MKYCRVYSVGNKKFGIGFEHKATSHPKCPKSYKHYWLSEMTVSFDTEEELNDFLKVNPQYGLE